MWIRADGQLSESTYLLTTPVSSHFVCFGDSAALIDSGIGAFGNSLVESLSAILAEDLPLKYILLTHAHADHVGGLPALRKAFPGVELVASPLTAEILLRDAEKLFEKNLRYAEGLKTEWNVTLEEFKAALKPNRLHSEGDSLSLGSDVTIKIIGCPGHTVDTTGYFILPDSALAAGEAVGGYNGRDKIAPCFLESREKFSETLDKLLTLDLKIILLPHSGALSGDLAKRFLMGVRDQTGQFLNAVKERVEAGAVKEELYFDILNEWTVDGLSPEGPFAEEQTACLRQMIEICLKSFEAE